MRPPKPEWKLCPPPKVGPLWMPIDPPEENPPRPMEAPPREPPRIWANRGVASNTADETAAMANQGRIRRIIARRQARNCQIFPALVLAFLCVLCGILGV